MRLKKFTLIRSEGKFLPNFQLVVGNKWTVREDKADDGPYFHPFLFIFYLVYLFVCLFVYSFILDYKDLGKKPREPDQYPRF